MKKTLNFTNPKLQGTFPDYWLRYFQKEGFIKNSLEENIKPSSLDLTLSSEIYEVEGTFQIPKDQKMEDRLAAITKEKHSFNNPLECNHTYLARLNEILNLPREIYGYCNPKSSSGRLDINCRVSASGLLYDAIPTSFEGDLWTFLVPQSFRSKLYLNLSLSQMRLFNCDTRLTTQEFIRLMDTTGLLFKRDEKKNHKIRYQELGVNIDDHSLLLSINLKCKPIGYKAKKTDKIIDLEKIRYYSPEDFFEPVELTNGNLHLKKGEFYILATYEYLCVPPGYACEISASDSRIGEFRSHFAGFVDAGWGYTTKQKQKGRIIVFEVRPYEDLIVYHRQPFARIKLERLCKEPKNSYETISSSHYTEQNGPTLAKQFKLNPM